MSSAGYQRALATAMADASNNIGALFSKKGAHDSKRGWLIGAAAICALAPLEDSQVVCLVLGMLTYLAMRMLEPASRSRPSGKNRSVAAAPAGAQHQGPAVPSKSPKRSTVGSARGHTEPRCQPGLRSEARAPAPSVPASCMRKPSVMPVVAPTFQAVGWDAEVQEMLARLAPTAEGGAAVGQIARSVELAVRRILPDATVHGYMYSSIQSGTAFGVAVPEVDIVVDIGSAALLRQLPGRWAQSCTASVADELKLQKAAIRACTDCLVGTGLFRFRRSAFREQEPKVTIIAPVALPNGSRSGVPISLSVNATVPRRHSALVARCGRLEPRARELMLLVRRWAKDRGMCHVAKGHISPYAWSLLVVYFLQVGLGEEEALLPPMGSLGAPPGLEEEEGEAVGHARAPSARATAGELFRRFLAFYAGFDWSREAVAVRQGRRAPPDPRLPLHRLPREGGGAEVGPSIEDPFKPSENLGSCMTSSGLRHMREELARARDLCSGDASLSALLEPWTPPEAEAAEPSEEGRDTNRCD